MSEQDETGEAGEITIEQAVAVAHRLMAENELQAAAALCGNILELVPEHPAALNVLAIAAHESGEIERALDLIRRAAAAAPEDSVIQNNLGNLLSKTRDAVGALSAYRRAAELGNKSPEMFNNLGVLLRARGEFVEAEQHFRSALAENPNHGPAHHNLGSILGGTGRVDEAVGHFWTGVLNMPVRNPYLTALAHNYFGRRDKAVEVFADLLKKDPDNVQLKHLMSSFSGVDVPERASDQYIEKTFDSFARSFDLTLKRLAYQAPKLVAAAVEVVVGPPRGDLEILDAGCGTGLCGALLRPFATRLIGVDLSAGMLEKAAAIGVYDELVKAELTAFLQGSDTAYDAIVLADTLCYFGSLETFAAAAANAVKPGGLLVFTVEALPAEAQEGFRVDLSGRYQHAGAYVDGVLKHAGFELLARKADTLRMERLDPVTGFVVSARRNSG
jgi:predicted TPR repeat methyltransferase